MKTIKSEEQYEAFLEELNTLMKRGEENMSDAEADRVETLALAIQAYEDIHYPFPIPKNVPELVMHK